MPTRKPPDPKLTALLEQGTANPRPEQVRDPAFQENDFFDPRDLVQVKYEMLRRVRSEGQTVVAAAAGFGVSRPTFYKAQSDFERDGLTGLLPAKRGPRGPHKVTADVVDFIRRAVAMEPDLDATALAQLLAHKLRVCVHPRTIERALAQSVPSKKKLR